MKTFEGHETEVVGMTGMLFDNIQLLPIKYPRYSRYFEGYLEYFASFKNSL